MAADGEQAREAEPKARIFISYSRKDMAFADRLDAALKQRGFEPLMDREEIYAFEDWWKRLQALINRSDTVVFVISPDAVASREALKEVEYAASLNKRFAPIVCRRAEDSATPEALRRLNFIFFDDRAQFESSADQLAEALRTDIGWIRQHTEFGEAAQRWSVAGRPGPRGLLLRSPVLEEAERWIASRPRGAPEPTEETQAFVIESRCGATRRRNILTGSLAAGLLVALALAGLAYWQRGVAVEQRNVAETRRIAMLAESATGEWLRGNWEAALKLGVHAARLGFAMEHNRGKISAPRTALAIAVSQSDLRLMLSGHEGSVFSAAFSPDGARIVTASEDKTARVWDAATGEEITVLRGHEGVVSSAAFSPDGSRIVTASEDKTARIWDASTGKEITVLRHEYFVTFADFSPDGSRIVTTSLGTARIWDAATGKEIMVLRGHESSVWWAAFSPDGKRVVTASGDISPSDNTVRIWDAASGKQITILRGHESLVWSAVFSPGGARIVTASDDKTARIWDAATGKEITVLRGHQDVVNSAAFSPDGSRIVTASGKSIVTARDDLFRGMKGDNSARIWDAATGKEIMILRGHEGYVMSAAFSPDGSRIVTASYDNTARVWDAGAGNEITVLRGHEGVVWSAAFSPDGSRIVTASDDKTARIWDASTGKEITVLRGHEGKVHCAAFSPDGARVVTASWGYPSSDNTARIWDAATGKETAVLRGHEESVNSAAFSPDGSRIVTASDDNTARVWDAATGKEIMVLRGHESSVNSAAFSPDGSQIVTASGHLSSSSDNTARIWDAASGKQITILRGHEGYVMSAAFSPDGSRIVTASYDNTARIWDVHFATMSAKDLLVEVCTRRLRGLTTLSRDEMRLAGYLDSTPEIDVCAGVE